MSNNYKPGDWAIVSDFKDDGWRIREFDHYGEEGTPIFCPLTFSWRYHHKLKPGSLIQFRSKPEDPWTVVEFSEKHKNISDNVKPIPEDCGVYQVYFGENKVMFAAEDAHSAAKKAVSMKPVGSVPGQLTLIKEPIKEKTMKPQQILVNYTLARATNLGPDLALKYFNANDVQDLLSWSEDQAQKTIDNIVKNLNKSSTGNQAEHCPWCVLNGVDCIACTYAKNHGGSCNDASSHYRKNRIHSRLEETVNKDQLLKLLGHGPKPEPKHEFKKWDKVLVSDGDDEPTERRHFLRMSDEGHYICTLYSQWTYEDGNEAPWENCIPYVEPEYREFKKGDRVLVRDGDEDWEPAVFDHMDDDGDFHVTGAQDAWYSLCKHAE